MLMVTLTNPKNFSSSSLLLRGASSLSEASFTMVYCRSAAPTVGDTCTRKEERQHLTGSERRKHRGDERSTETKEEHPIHLPVPLQSWRALDK
eukprot:m.26054 g.26054  ORF g.26054 m.26054 type:complete len:93 (+) comp11641_c0_seq2:645-923(+)